MNMLGPIVAEVHGDTRALVARLAAERGITKSQSAAEAFQRVAESEADYRTFVQAGIDAIDRGEFVSHEEVLAELDAMIAGHLARCVR